MSTLDKKKEDELASTSAETQHDQHHHAITTATNKIIVDGHNLKINGSNNSNDDQQQQQQQQYQSETLDFQSYEHALLSSWDEDISNQNGFDWEIEKLRRYFAGLRRSRDSDGSWVRTPSIFDFLVTYTPKEEVGVTYNNNDANIIFQSYLNINIPYLFPQKPWYFKYFINYKQKQNKKRLLPQYIYFEYIIDCIFQWHHLVISFNLK